MPWLYRLVTLIVLSIQSDFYAIVLTRLSERNIPMSDNVKAALIVAGAAIICVILRIYFSPYYSCVRSQYDVGWCARATGGQIPFH